MQAGSFLLVVALLLAGSEARLELQPTNDGRELQLSVWLSHGQVLKKKSYSGGLTVTGLGRPVTEQVRLEVKNGRLVGTWPLLKHYKAKEGPDGIAIDLKLTVSDDKGVQQSLEAKTSVYDLEAAGGAPGAGSTSALESGAAPDPSSPADQKTPEIPSDTQAHDGADTPRSAPFGGLQMFAYSITAACALLLAGAVYLYLNLRTQQQRLSTLEGAARQSATSIETLLRKGQEQLQAGLADPARRPEPEQPKTPASVAIPIRSHERDAAGLTVLEPATEAPAQPSLLPSQDIKNAVNRWWQSDAKLGSANLDSIRQEECPESEYFEAKNLSDVGADISTYMFEPVQEWSGWLFAKERDGIYYAVPTHAGHFRSPLSDKLLQRLYDGPALTGGESFGRIERACTLKKESQGFRCVRKGVYELKG